MVLKTSEALQADKDLSFSSALDQQIESELFDSVQFSDFFFKTTFAFPARVSAFMGQISFCI